MQVDPRTEAMCIKLIQSALDSCTTERMQQTEILCAHVFQCNCPAIRNAIMLEYCYQVLPPYIKESV